MRDNETVRSIFKIFEFIQEDNVIQTYEACKEHMGTDGDGQQLTEDLNSYNNNFIGRHNSASLSYQLLLIRLWISQTYNKGRILALCIHTFFRWKSTEYLKLSAPLQGN
ncbi:LOW QUALITY PROTEIN: hypothetical protein HZS_2652 [Henneguya salminicola]|nr:LOW QUALITY PROTEIN: hypothetical protein HZS_2652 [Henneguya salminicola]